MNQTPRQFIPATDRVPPTDEHAAARLAAGRTAGTGKESVIYGHRFSPRQQVARETTWRLLCQHFFQRYVEPTDTVVDVGSGDGLFLKNITARRKIAIDLAPRGLPSDVEVVAVPATAFAERVAGTVDVVFMSNFLEHLASKRDVLVVLEQCWAVLRPGGRLLVLQPNIRYVGAAYWDYIDHHIALTEHSLVEALEITGFTIEEVRPRFLPYTARSSLSAFAGLTRWYVRLPFLWRIFGKQAFVVARRAFASEKQP